MAINNNWLRALYIDELRDIYNAEKQLTKVVPKMVKSATLGELRRCFTEHLEQTRSHVEHLEQILEALGERPSSRKYGGKEGLIEEGPDTDEAGEANVSDEALISGAQRVADSEIAAYETVCGIAELLGQWEHLSLLLQTLEEEKQTDAKLTELSKQINTAVNAQTSENGSRFRRHVSSLSRDA